MNRRLFLKKKEVWLSLLSLLGQFIIMSAISFILFFTDVSAVKAALLFLVLLGFSFIAAVTLLRLADLAKATDSEGKKS